MTAERRKRSSASSRNFSRNVSFFSAAIVEGTFRHFNATGARNASLPMRAVHDGKTPLRDGLLDLEVGCLLRPDDAEDVVSH